MTLSVNQLHGLSSPVLHRSLILRSPGSCHIKTTPWHPR